MDDTLIYDPRFVTLGNHIAEDLCNRFLLIPSYVQKVLFVSYSHKRSSLTRKRWVFGKNFIFCLVSNEMHLWFRLSKCTHRHKRRSRPHIGMKRKWVIATSFYMDLYTERSRKLLSVFLYRVVGKYVGYFRKVLVTKQTSFHMEYPVFGHRFEELSEIWSIIWLKFS